MESVNICLKNDSNNDGYEKRIQGEGLTQYDLPGFYRWRLGQTNGEDVMDLSTPPPPVAGCDFLIEHSWGGGLDPRG